jgi:threonine aldolase
MFVVDSTAHVLRAEGRAYDKVAQLRAHAVDGPNGHPTVDQLEAALDGSDRLALLWLENTHTYAGGTIAPIQASREIVALAARSDVRVHLDGARLWNAAVATGRSMDELAAGADSVTVNLNKALGCPAGSVLCGSQAFVDSARDLAVALGGFVAQAGLLAAAGLVALDDYEDVIRRDHELASWLADGLRAAGVDVDQPETNIVLVRVADAVGLRTRLARRGVLAFVRDPATIRFVTHRQIGEPEIERVVAMAGVLTGP